MKTKLLKRLRREAKDRYTLAPREGGYTILQGIYDYNIRPIKNFDEAVALLIKRRREYILAYVANERRSEEFEKLKASHHYEI